MAPEGLWWLFWLGCILVVPIHGGSSAKSNGSGLTQRHLPGLTKRRQLLEIWKDQEIPQHPCHPQMESRLAAIWNVLDFCLHCLGQQQAPQMPLEFQALLDDASQLLPSIAAPSPISQTSDSGETGAAALAVEDFAVLARLVVLTRGLKEVVGFWNDHQGAQFGPEMCSALEQWIRERLSWRLLLAETSMVATALDQGRWWDDSVTGQDRAGPGEKKGAEGTNGLFYSHLARLEKLLNPELLVAVQQTLLGARSVLEALAESGSPPSVSMVRVLDKIFERDGVVFGAVMKQLEEHLARSCGAVMERAQKAARTETRTLRTSIERLTTLIELTLVVRCEYSRLVSKLCIFPLAPFCTTLYYENGQVDPRMFALVILQGLGGAQQEEKELLGRGTRLLKKLGIEDDGHLQCLRRLYLDQPAWHRLRWSVRIPEFFKDPESAFTRVLDELDDLEDTPDIIDCLEGPCTDSTQYDQLLEAFTNAGGWLEVIFPLLLLLPIYHDCQQQRQLPSFVRESLLRLHERLSRVQDIYNQSFIAAVSHPDPKLRKTLVSALQQATDKLRVHLTRYERTFFPKND